MKQRLRIVKYVKDLFWGVYSCVSLGENSVKHSHLDSFFSLRNDRDISFSHFENLITYNASKNVHLHKFLTLTVLPQ